ncbi:MAG: HD domain-containing protein [Spirochaetaceae bacterium]|nr:HD domain-containing protein [Spirochaetaceae bacterium]
MEKELQSLRQADEKNANRYVLIVLSANFLILVLAWILNELNLFHIDKFLCRICVLISFIFTLLPWIYYANPRIVKPEKLKYYITFHILFLTLLAVCLLNMHVTLFLIFPLLTATHYHSKAILRISAIGGCIIAVIAPLISIRLNTFDPTFLFYLFKMLKPEYTLGSKAVDEYIQTLPLSPYIGYTFFYGLPHFLTMAGFSIIVLTVNRSRNENLQARATERNIIQDDILFSVANLIENRDTSTGSHVKRTSDIVRILALEIMKTDRKHSSSFWNSVIKAAPMHDLGKIAIPDSILRKPARLTPEEFEIIKTHSQKSVDIIDQVLKGIETEEFLTIAKNIAKYHHERFDGSGYPSHLKGNEIPIEARVMAIADVFDALCSERPYKKYQTPEEAAVIIEESMGSHFDPHLYSIFKACFPQLREYYEIENSRINF